MGTLASGSIDLKSLKVAGESATSYITAIDNNGIKVHAANNIDLNYTQITSDGMEIFKTNGAESNPSAISIARFGEVVRIGKQDDNYFWIDTAGIYLKNKALSIFQIQAEAVNEGPDVNLKLYNKDGKTLGFYINKTTHNYHVQDINFSFDDASLTEGDTFTIKFNWSGRVVFNKKTSSTGYSYVARTYNEELYTHNFIYNTSATISHSLEYDGSSQYSRQQIFRIEYDGKNNIKIVPTQNSFTDSDRMDYVRPYYFFNIVVFTSQQLSALPTVTIGPQEISHAEIDYHSFQMIDKNGNSFLHISDLQDINGYVTDTFIGDGTTVDFPLTFFCENTVDYIVTVDGVLNTDNHIYQGQGFYSLLEFYPNEQPSSNAEIIIKYKALDTYAYTFGTRDNSSVIGKFSTTIGENLKANANHQVVIGKHNQIESLNWNFPEKNKVFIIGNGTSNNPSNALTVDWKGRVECGDYSGVFKSIFNILYPIGSYYETSLPTTPISGHSFNDDNLTDEEIADCGISWFDPRVMWGGTWVLEVAGMVHVSAGTGYSVNHANDNNGVGAQDGGSPYIQEHSHGFTGGALPTHTHGMSHTHVPNSTTYKYFMVTSSSGITDDTSAALSDGNYKFPRISSNYAFTSHSTTGTSSITSTGNNTSATISGTVGNINTANLSKGQSGNMQPYIVVYRWHRYA